MPGRGQWAAPVPGVNDTPRRTWALAAVCTVWKASPGAGEVVPGWSVMVGAGLGCRTDASLGGHFR
jgi:hypothetical protein